MKTYFRIIKILDFIVELGNSLIVLIRKNSKKTVGIVAGVSLALIVVLSLPPSLGKETLYITLDSATYDNEKRVIQISASTNFPEDTEIMFGLAGKIDEYSVSVPPEPALVKNGKLNVVLGPDSMVNGTFDIRASFSVNKDRDRNLHLFDEFGDYKEFKKIITLMEN